MLNLIYPYRNRDLQRLKNSFESLARQTSKEFKVFFIDYGSDPKTAEKVKKLCAAYSFISYQYCFTQFQPWNKSRALNSVIKTLESGFCFVADVDIIFHSTFVEKAISLQETDKSLYFQVGFTSEKDKIRDISENRFHQYRKSTAEATGLTMFPVEVLKKLRGFDEFYHFWGAEDTDMHARIKNAGFQLEYFDKEVLLLHQWHKSYRASETQKLSRRLQVQGIVQINHQYLKLAIQQKKTIINQNSWGNILSKADFLQLEAQPVNLKLTNEKAKIQAFLYGELPGLENQILKLRIEKSTFEGSGKFRLKKIFGKKVPEYYSLKEINDLLLLQVISFYRDKPYIYKIGADFKSIEFAIKC
ncbi:N-terminal domain of galactosyltransferase [Salegentibacter echinorum]|uniref:N-terminal domain of galactosyltransferase n=1 Tax=Salegentibacter echinorum TaxID=1073325 RepID=A0A1M5JVS1_SALEC|nr:N-terminal domain of galactosyltransferase [Salegentibacter echinorum]